MDMSDNEREQQNKRLYCDSPPEHQIKLVNIPSKDRDYSYMDKTPKKSRLLCDCGKDWKFWAGISITGLIIALFIGNMEYGFLTWNFDFVFTFEIPMWFFVGELYFLLTLSYIFPYGILVLGVLGLRAYCNQKSIWHKDSMCFYVSLLLLTVGSITAYVFAQPESTEMLHRMIERYGGEV